MFSDYIKIDEARIAKTAKVEDRVVASYLTKLNNQRIINYFPGKKTALLIFTVERLALESMMISIPKYEERKKRYLKQIEAMVNYAQGTAKCRSQYLIEYFGQNVSRCGNCDVCRKRNLLELSKLEFDNILKEIKFILEDGPMESNELIHSVNSEEEKAVKVIRHLLDTGKMMLENNKIKWNA